MFETVANTSMEDDYDIRPLLLMMDIGSCASAEKHTRVNCVTASMGDVVIEHYPKVGELLELRAVPVNVGNTSLNIAVLVLAHGCSSDKADEKEEHNVVGPMRSSSTTTRTKRVCEAFFTYVTTRGPNGEKRFVPPLEDDVDSIHKNMNNDYRSDTSWERTIARFRKQLILSEQAFTKHPRGYTIPRSQSIFECSEVVLPSHQNHMKHLFGGIVMGWMCKSVMAACVIATRLPLSCFRIRSIQRVDFPEGAEVSDHVFLRPRITAIFDEGKSAEFEVMVGKRHVTGENSSSNNNNNNQEETMNFGYFYVSGDLHEKNKHSSPLSRAPFAGLLEEQRKSKVSKLSNTSNSNSNNSDDVAARMAHKRRTALLARRQLLAGLGNPIPWDSSLEVQAPIMTILWVLRLCDEYEKSSNDNDDGGAIIDSSCSSCWTRISHGEIDQPTSQTNTFHSPIDCEWAYGNPLGHHNTFVLRSNTVIFRKKGISKNSFLQDVYRTLTGMRCRWDPFCMSVTVLEEKDDNYDIDSVDKEDEDSVYWDVAEYHMKASSADAKLCLLRAAAYINDDGSIVGHSNRGDSFDTTSSIGVVASRSVRHVKSNTESRVLPSGLLLKTIEQQQHNTADEDDEYLQITYMAEVRCLNKENTKHKQIFRIVLEPNKSDACQFLRHIVFVSCLSCAFILRAACSMISMSFARAVPLGPTMYPMITLFAF